MLTLVSIGHKIGKKLKRREFNTQKIVSRKKKSRKFHPEKSSSKLIVVHMLDMRIEWCVCIFDGIPNRKLKLPVRALFSLRVCLLTSIAVCNINEILLHIFENSSEICVLPCSVFTCVRARSLARSLRFHSARRFFLYGFFLLLWIRIGQLNEIRGESTSKENQKELSLWIVNVE